MLRYSTSTTRRAATVAQEVEHVRTYLFLMKKRLEHKLEFSIEVDPSILEERIPKIVLQQIVENCITHGFGAKKSLHISLVGKVKGDRWRIEVSDDGKGFEGAVLEGLRRKAAELTANPSGALYDGSALGGMGLANLFSRLALFYEGDFDFELENATGGGAFVAIGARRGSGGGVCADGNPC
jgi:two-component system, sensor histidine kinase YesM